MSATTLWTPAQDDELGRLWALGTRARLIGKVLGKTKNAVLGRANRTGLPAHISGRHVLTVQERINRERLRERRRLTGPKRALTHARRPPLKTTPLPKPVPLPPTCAPVTLLEAEAFHCRYPADDATGSALRFCGAPKADGSYCEYHRSIAYQPAGNRVSRQRQSEKAMLGRLV